MKITTKATVHIAVFVSWQLASADDCLDAVNKYRGMAGKPPLQKCGASEEQTAQQQCSWDASHGFHNWVKTKGWSGTCTGMGEGQCEAETGAGQDSAVKMYYNEGPGGGHYDIMMSTKNHCVACGVSGNFYTHNFCPEGGSPAPAPPAPGPSPSGGGSIKAWGTSKCLDLPGGDTSNGNKLWLWECNGQQSQQWKFDAGTWHISPGADSSKCIDIPGGDTTSGNILQIWDCNGHDNQKFGYDSSQKTIYDAWSGHVKCLDVNWGDGSGTNTKLQLWDCNGHSNQWWYLSGTAETTELSNSTKVPFSLV